MSSDKRNEGLWDEINKKRDFTKCPDIKTIMINSDQQKELPQPPLNNAAKAEVIELSSDFTDAVKHDLYTELLDIRRSERIYDKNAVMTQNQLAFLLWSIHGVQEIIRDGYAALRPVPSGGARHPFEIYFIVRNVEGLKPGKYHYLPMEHPGEKRAAIEFIGDFPNHDKSVAEMAAGQKWARNASVIILLSCVAYRAEWRYNHFAHRVILIDLGHAGQNLMLSAAAMGLGSCCMAAYDQELCDEIFGLDGSKEYTVYVCSVGKTKQVRKK